MDARAPHILVVDDEQPIVELVTGYLAREGWSVASTGDGLDALRIARETSPDVVVLDLMLPGLDGVEVCRQLRTFSDAYVVMVTARSEEIDRIVGLSVGADDYLVKPFSPRELVARVKAMLRRPRAGAAVSGADSDGGTGAETVPGLRVDVPRRQVRVDDDPVELTALEFNLLARLAREPGVVVGRPSLLEELWGAEYLGDDHLLDVHVGNLRRKLGDEPASPRFVETVRGVGFRLRDGG